MSIAAVLSLLAAAAAQISEAPVEFKGVAVGQPTTYAEVSQKMGFTCEYNPSSTYFCQGFTMVADARTMVTVLADKQGVVQEIVLNFDSLLYPMIKARLNDKYGKAFQEQSSPVQNGYGARFEFAVTDWKSRHGLVELSSIDPDVNHGSLKFIAWSSPEIHIAPEGGPKVGF